jgi:Family of unknown function (DUF6500)
MRESLRRKIVEICDRKIEQKGPNVGLLFYAFFANRNDDPDASAIDVDWAEEMARLLEGRYANCERVILVCDNLNTHN